VTTQSPVQVFGADEQSAVPIDVMRWLQLAQLVLREERVSPEMEVSLIFVDEDAMTDLNQRFLDGTGPTDVLSFPMDEVAPPSGRQPDEGGRGPGASDETTDPPLVLGDVVVCPAFAAAQAEAGDRPLDDELALLVVHGVLHLLDYDHAEPADAQRMQQRERELLARFGEVETQALTAEPNQDSEQRDPDSEQP
jgi:probable rRNA maturation factor